jgi:1,4-alpha-glucan branching enzyme
MVAIIRQYNVLAAEPPRILNVDPQAQSLAFERAGLIFTFNFSPTESLADYAVWVPEPGKYINVLSSDEVRFDGLGRAIPGTEHFTDEERRIRFYNCNRTAQVFAREA